MFGFFPYFALMTAALQLYQLHKPDDHVVQHDLIQRASSTLVEAKMSNLLPKEIEMSQICLFNQLVVPTRNIAEYYKF